MVVWEESLEANAKIMSVSPLHIIMKFYDLRLGKCSVVFVFYEPNSLFKLYSILNINMQPFSVMLASPYGNFL